MIKDLYFICGKYSHIWLNISKDDCDLHLSLKKKLFKKTLNSRYLHQRIVFGKISQSGHRKKALKTSTKANFGKKKKLAHTNEEKTFKVAIFRQEVVM
jgi:hypothetical protein